MTLTLRHSHAPRAAPLHRRLELLVHGTPIIWSPSRQGDGAPQLHNRDGITTLAFFAPVRVDFDQPADRLWGGMPRLEVRGASEQIKAWGFGHEALAETWLDLFPRADPIPGLWIGFGDAALCARSLSLFQREHDGLWAHLEADCRIGDPAPGETDDD